MSAARSNGRFDLDQAAAAALAESKPVPFDFTYKGGNYSVPAAVTWPLEAQAHIAAGELEDALTMLLGEDQYKALVSAGMTIGELGVLFQAVGENAGVGGLGNSLAPAQRDSIPT